MKKLLSAVLVVCIFFSLSCITAFAVQERQVTDSVGLEAALTAASDGDTIVLNGDITLENSITVDNVLNFRFNGNSLWLNGNSITVSAEATILDEAHIYGSSSGVIVSGSGEIVYDKKDFYLHDGVLGTITFDPSADPSSSIKVNEIENSDGIHIVPIPPLPSFPSENISSSYKNYGTDAPDLTYAMQFYDPLEISLIQASYYGGWYADFVVTVNKNVVFGPDAGADGYLAGHYAPFSANWISVPLSNVDYTADTPYALMSSVVTPWTVEAIYTGVQKFECGIHFSDEFIAKNPDLKVSVQLRISPSASGVATGTVVASKEFIIEPPAVNVPATDDNSHAVLWAILLVMFTATAVISGKKRLTKS